MDPSPSQHVSPRSSGGRRRWPFVVAALVTLTCTAAAVLANRGFGSVWAAVGAAGKSAPVPRDLSAELASNDTHVRLGAMAAAAQRIPLDTGTRRALEKLLANPRHHVAGEALEILAGSGVSSEACAESLDAMLANGPGELGRDIAVLGRIRADLVLHCLVRASRLGVLSPAGRGLVRSLERPDHRTISILGDLLLSPHAETVQLVAEVLSAHPERLNSAEMAVHAGLETAVRLEPAFVEGALARASEDLGQRLIRLIAKAPAPIFEQFVAHMKVKPPPHPAWLAAVLTGPGLTKDRERSASLQALAERVRAPGPAPKPIRAADDEWAAGLYADSLRRGDPLTEERIDALDSVVRGSIPESLPHCRLFVELIVRAVADPRPAVSEKVMWLIEARGLAEAADRLPDGAQRVAAALVSMRAPAESTDRESVGQALEALLATGHVDVNPLRKLPGARATLETRMALAVRLAAVDSAACAAEIVQVFKLIRDAHDQQEFIEKVINGAGLAPLVRTLLASTDADAPETAATLLASYEGKLTADDFAEFAKSPHPRIREALENREFFGK